MAKYLVESEKSGTFAVGKQFLMRKLIDKR
jgi:hypothetical protein